MLKILTKYASIGVINTAIHWIVFGLLCYLLGTTQAAANLAGFCVAVTFSFYANAHFTFKKKATGKRYFAFVTFMGLISFLTGHLSDVFKLPPIATFLIFSPASVIIGFVYFNFIVFKGDK
ncbi:TPA: GtrA family protein [Escherichia coli]|nr:GtrA family protein [Escherichia coli]